MSSLGQQEHRGKGRTVWHRAGRGNTERIRETKEERVPPRHTRKCAPSLFGDGIGSGRRKVCIHLSTKCPSSARGRANGTIEWLEIPFRRPPATNFWF